MMAVIQVVSQASVTKVADTSLVEKIDRGYLILLGVSKTDSESDVAKLADKIIKLRIFTDENQKMNLDCKSVGGEILLISQFTLLANTKGSNRPDFAEAAGRDLAERLYLVFADTLRQTGINVKTGFFGEHMLIDSKLDGPVTICLNSKTS